MLRFWRKPRERSAVDILHGEIVDAARRAEFYGPGALPDTVQGRFEALVLHVLVVLRRLRQLPPPADELAQELVDAVFSHLEIALRETGVGDFGVPKRMKKLGQAFYDRAAEYDPLIGGADVAGLARAVAARLDVGANETEALARLAVAAEDSFRAFGLSDLLNGSPFGSLPAAEAAA